MKCVYCQRENRTGAKFCEQCGKPLSRVCPSCGSELSAQAKFCVDCGHQLPSTDATDRVRVLQNYTPKHLAEKILSSRSALEGERKQVTVLFVDIVGSTAQSERLDPEEAHALMSR